MMQNGFRRIALAQGLLPDGLSANRAPASAEPDLTLHPLAADSAITSAGTCGGDRDSARNGASEIRVACVA